MPEIPDPRQQPAEARRAREQRIRDLRRRVAAVAVALFVAAWGGLYVQLVSGHDPALAGEVAPVAQSADPTAVSDDSSDDGWSDGTTDEGWNGSSTDDTLSSGDDGSSSASEPAAVTTRQS
jgi:hypothetical protein